MRECRTHRTQFAGCAQNHCDRVDRTREQNDVLPCRLDRLAADFEKFGQTLQRMRQINYVGSLGRNIACACYSDSDSRRSQRRRIVDPSPTIAT